MARPSHKELNGKLQAALQAVHDNMILLVEPAAIVADSLPLGYSIRNELQVVLLDLLNSTGPEHYAGRRPPENLTKHRFSIMIYGLFRWLAKGSTIVCTTSFHSVKGLFIWCRFTSAPEW